MHVGIDEFDREDDPSNYHEPGHDLVRNLARPASQVADAKTSAESEDREPEGHRVVLRVEQMADHVKEQHTRHERDDQPDHLICHVPGIFRNLVP